MNTNSTPRRIQLLRRAGWKMPPNTIKFARPTEFGNPHKIGYCSYCDTTHTREEAIAKFEALIKGVSAHQERVIHSAIRKRLKGKNLACWCKLDEACHADVLLRIANAI